MKTQEKVVINNESYVVYVEVEQKVDTSKVFLVKERRVSQFGIELGEVLNTDDFAVITSDSAYRLQELINADYRIDKGILDELHAMGYTDVELDKDDYKEEVIKLSGAVFLTHMN